MTQELREILSLVSEGRITVEQGLTLIQALGGGKREGQAAASGGRRPRGGRAFLISREGRAGSGASVRTRRIAITADEAGVLKTTELTPEQVAEIKRTLDLGDRGDPSGR